MLYGHKVMKGKIELLVSLNPYFFGKCSTARRLDGYDTVITGLNPYFFGKCSTAVLSQLGGLYDAYVLILIFLENALRRSARRKQWSTSG